MSRPCANELFEQEDDHRPFVPCCTRPTRAGHQIRFVKIAHLRARRSDAMHESATHAWLLRIEQSGFRASHMGMDMLLLPCHFLEMPDR